MMTDFTAETCRLGKVGVWTVGLDHLDVPAAIEAVAKLEAQGWGSLWIGEAFGREAFTAAQLYLSAGSRLIVGTGIANIYARDAMTTAAAARTLSTAYPGRFVLGLGVSHSLAVEQMRGHHYGKPVAAMREYLDGLDAAPHFGAGDPTLPQRVLAALGPRMTELARDRTQGAHTYLVTADHTAAARELLGPDRLLVVEQAVVVDDDPEIWRARANAHLETYTSLPNYRNSWLRQGFTELDIAGGGSEALKDALVARGLDGTTERLREHFDAGADTVVVQALGDHLADVRQDDWARLAEALL
jgi:probable F420-dependent oxidoreductase